jgi:catechol 2,3-dioxygenase-like lactoylglutathione lyase family enzyme
MSLSTHKVRPSIAVSDISRSAEFYELKLGLRAGPEQSDESRIDACGSDTSLHVHVSHGSGGATATLATWYVPDLARAVDELAANDVSFDRYDGPVLSTNETGIHQIANGRVAWFKDPDGNAFAIEEGTR